MEAARVLHIASFSGNTGDGAMHDGAIRTRSEDIDRPLTYQRIEIREFIHWASRSFDDSFIEMAKNSDLVLFGGNSIFQMWRDNTASGTYFDFEPDFLLKLEKPVVFYGIGCDATRGVHPVSVERTRATLDHCADPNRFLYSLRNDGSSQLISTELGASYANRMSVIPDGGLFAEPKCFTPRRRQYVILNIAGDMPDIRFGNHETDERDFGRYLAKEIEHLLASRPDLDVVFIPHVFSDIAIIAKCLDALDDRLRRSRVEVASYQVDEEAWAKIFALYRNATAVLAMRFHANLVPIGLGVPTVGLSSHHKVAGLFSGLGLEDRCVSLEKGSARSALSSAFTILADSLEQSDAEAIRSRQMTARRRERDSLSQFHGRIATFLNV